MSVSIRRITSFLMFAYLALGIPMAWLALLLVVGAETGAGRWFGGTCLFLFPVPLLWWIRWFLRKKRILGLWCFGLCLAATCSGFACLLHSPPGYASDETGFQSVHQGPGRHRRFSPANLVPEIDQLKLGSYLFPQIDPYLDEEKGERVRALFLKIYRQSRRRRKISC